MVYIGCFWIWSRLGEIPYEKFSSVLFEQDPDKTVKEEDKTAYYYYSEVFRRKKKWKKGIEILEDGGGGER